MMKILVLLLAIVVASKATDPFKTQKLVKDLLKNYLKEVDPGTTNLTLGISYLCADLSRYSLQLTSKVVERYEWLDSRLKWDPSKYDGIKHIRLPASSIWNPDFKVYNTLLEPETRDDVNVVIFANGTVLWIPMVVYKTYCEPGKDKGDFISCQINIGSWTYDANTLMLQSLDLDKESMYQAACPYVIGSSKVEVKTMFYPCCPEPYSSMQINFEIHHRL
jgi:hypothetical protein